MDTYVDVIYCFGCNTCLSLRDETTSLLGDTVVDWKCPGVRFAFCDTCDTKLDKHNAEIMTVADFEVVKACRGDQFKVVESKEEPIEEVLLSMGEDYHMCPHCRWIFQLEEINCAIFRCGRLIRGGQIPQHATEEEINQLIRDGLLVDGCGRPMVYNKSTKKFEASLDYR